MPLLLRPHHGMCFQFYQGKGYDDTFTGHMGKIINNLSSDPTQIIQLLKGTDIICNNCPNSIDGVCADQNKATRYDESVLNACGLQVGEKLSYSEFITTIKEKIIDTGLRASICGDCCWNALCSK